MFSHVPFHDFIFLLKEWIRRLLVLCQLCALCNVFLRCDDYNV